MLYLELDKNKKRLIKVQIYNQIREKILNGELKSGTRLPSTRELSSGLNVSRNTVLSVYEMLMSEGYVYSIAGSGVYVNKGVHAIKPSNKMFDICISSLSNDVISQDIIDFDSGIPAIDLFPRGKWNRVVTRSFNEAPISVLGYDYPEGRLELRRILLLHLPISSRWEVSCQYREDWNWLNLPEKTDAILLRMTMTVNSDIMVNRSIHCTNWKVNM